MNTRFHAHGVPSRRELQMLITMARGRRDKESAEEHGLSLSSVGNYIRRGLRKLGAGNRAHAVTILHERGYLRPCSDQCYKAAICQRPRVGEPCAHEPPTPLEHEGSHLVPPAPVERRRHRTRAPRAQAPARDQPRKPT